MYDRNAIQATVSRLQGYLAAFGHKKRGKYPLCWDEFEALRRKRGISLPDWPQWCYCPVAGAMAVVTGGEPDIHHFKHGRPWNSWKHDLADVGSLAALAAWRITQGIYLFDETL